MAKVSVICPVLNAVKYINEMVDSVIKQTLCDIEIIIVDAGSTDGTFDVLKEYAKKDMRIRLLTSNKKSVGFQCNIGMAAATGDYIGFVEADDYVDTNMFEQLYMTAHNTGADIVKSNFDMFFDADDGERIFLTYQLIPNSQKDLYNRRLKPEEYAEMVFRDVNIWNGIYKSSFIKKKGICSNETPGAAFQDMGFNLQSYMLADSIVYKEDSFYRYRRDNESSSVYNNKAVKYVVDEFEFMKGILENNKVKAEYFNAAIGQRIFGVFLGFYTRLDPKVQESSEMEHMIRDFSNSFCEFYRGIGTPELSQYNFRQSMALELLSESIDEFKKYIYDRYRIDRNALTDYIEFFTRQEQIVIFGCGERGSSTYTFFRRNGVKKMVGFCDNNKQLWNQTFMKEKVFSPEEAVKEYPDALYLIANDANFFEIKRQLQRAGVSCGHIYKAMPILPHTAAEFL